MQIADAKQAKSRRVSSQDLGTKPKPGRPKNQSIAKIRRVEKCSRSEAYRKLEKKRLRNRTLRQRLEDEQLQFSSIIKPSDNWNIAPVLYSRINDEDGYGYIPGELYCNCLWYFTRPADLVIARWLVVV